MTTSEILAALNRAGYLPYADDYNVATVNLDDHGGAVKIESDGTGNVACEARAL